MTSALMPEMPRARLRGTRRGAPRRCRGRTPRRRRCRSSRSPAAPGSRRSGKPCGRPSLKNVYSCSMPNSGSWPANFSATGASSARVLVGCGVMSVSSTSHITSTLSPPRIGSGHDEHGLQHAVGCLARRLVRARTVEAPDRQARQIALPSRIFVFDRRRAVGSVPSIQMYSALITTVAPVLGARTQCPRRASSMFDAAFRRAISRPLPECERSVTAPVRPRGGYANVPTLCAWSANWSTSCAPSRSAACASSGSGSPTCSAS